MACLKNLVGNPIFINSIIKNVSREFSISAPLYRVGKVNIFGLNFDRRIKVSHEDSIKYMESEAYKKTYRGHIIWKLYRRQHKNQLPSKNTRHSCINSEGFVDTSYPCPICRDEYLVIHKENAKLLEQFIDRYTGKILPTTVHGLCQKQFRNLIIAIHQAKDIGSLTFEVPDRLYDYSQYYNTSNK